MIGRIFIASEESIDWSKKNEWNYDKKTKIIIARKYKN